MTLARQLTGLALQLVATVIVARTLGPEGNGLFAALMLLPGLLAVMLNPGVPASIVYFLAGRRIALLDLWAVLYPLALVISVCGLLVGCALVFAAGRWLFGDEPRSLLLLGLLFFPLQLVQSWHVAVLQGARRFRAMNAVLVVGPVFSLVFVVAWKLFGTQQVGTLLGVTLMASALTTVGAILAARRISEVGNPAGNSKEVGTSQILHYGLRNHAGNVAGYLNYRADMYVVLAMTGPAATGIYALSVQLAEKLFVISQAASAVLLPTFVEMNGQRSDRILLVAVSARWSLLFTAIAAAGLMVCVSLAFHLLFGEGYAGLPEVLLLLSFGATATGYSRVVANDIAAQGRPEFNAWTGVTAAGCNMLLALLLVPRHGIEGAAVASSIAFVLDAILKVMSFCYINKCNIGALVNLGPERSWLAAHRRSG